MLKATTFALAAATLLAIPGANAQTIDLGRDGPRIDLRSRDRDRDYRRDHDRRDFDRRSRYDRRDLGTGSLGRSGCKSVTVRERDDFGRTVTRTRSNC